MDIALCGTTGAQAASALMRVAQQLDGRWAVCEDDGTILQTWKTERCALFDMQCYR